MGLILFIIVVLVVLALVLWAITLLPLPSPPHIKEIIMALVVILAALIIASHAGIIAL